MSSIHRFYASDAALGELICTNRTDNESKIIILGKEAHTLPNASCSFQLPLRPQHMLLVPLALALNSVCSSTFASKAVHVFCPPTGTAHGADFSSLLGPCVCSGARGLGSAPDFVTKLCVTVRKLLCLLEPQLPHLLIRDDGNADGDLDLTRTK